MSRDRCPLSGETRHPLSHRYREILRSRPLILRDGLEELVGLPYFGYALTGCS